MRQAHNARRSRGRSNRKHNVPLKHQSFESNGPDVRIRGNAHQVYEKYLAMARDAQSTGDRISAEGYYQHAEHYFRIMNDSTDPQGGQRQQQQRQRENGHDRQGQDGDQRADGVEPAKAADGTEPAGAGDGAEAAQVAGAEPAPPASDAEPTPAAVAEAAVNGAEVNGGTERPAPKRRRRAPKAAKPEEGEAAKDDEDSPSLPGV
ncbi:MAG: DUF4167 domain-containing protein [Kiloniellales bacterium]|nr:DUF4167 domain-containing protein [Kiloniellales bacterium]